MNLLMSWSISTAALDAVGDSSYRWGFWVPIVYDWTYSLLTPTQVATITSEYNNYTEIMLSKGWGSAEGGFAGNNYYWGNFENELTWALASYYQNPMAPTFLYNALVSSLAETPHFLTFLVRMQEESLRRAVNTDLNCSGIS